MASRDEFVAAFPPLVKELLDELSSDFEMPPYAVHWIETVRLRSLARGYTASILTVVRVFSLLGFGSASQPLGSRRQDDSRIDGRVDA